MVNWHEKLFLLDQYFPYFLLIYGFFVCLAIETPALQKIAKENPKAIFQLEKKRWLAWTCLIFGGLWSLQNLWLYSPGL